MVATATIALVLVVLGSLLGGHLRGTRVRNAVAAQAGKAKRPRRRPF